MSRHWDPNRSGWQAQRPRRRPPNRRRAAPARGRSAAQFGVTFASVTAFGLLWAAWTNLGPLGPGPEAGSPGDVSVIDGDTFDFLGTRIRIADIDTPEMRGRCPYETGLARRAAARTGALLREGPFELHRTGTRDEDVYGRKLRIVTRGGRSLGDVLVAEGLARTWTGRREPWC